MKLIQWRENKNIKNLSNKECYGSFQNDTGFRVVVGNSNHLTWDKVKSKAYRMTKNIEAEKAANSVAVEVAVEKERGRPIGSRVQRQERKRYQRKEDFI